MPPNSTEAEQRKIHHYRSFVPVSMTLVALGLALALGALAATTPVKIAVVFGVGAAACAYYAWKWGRSVFREQIEVSGDTLTHVHPNGKETTVSLKDVMHIGEFEEDSFANVYVDLAGGPKIKISSTISDFRALVDHVKTHAPQARASENLVEFIRAVR